MTRGQRVSLGVAAWLLALHAPASASAPELAAGREIARQGVLAGHAACAACHLANGAGQPQVGIPRLAGLKRAYLDQQLDYFASGKRRNPVMQPYARMLSHQQRGEVASYYASLPVPTPVETKALPPELLAHGKRIAEYGDPEAGMPSCSQCHGVSGLGVGDFSPALAGQSAAYIATELTAWHGGAKRDPKGIFMQAEARNLSPADIRAVAAYLASLPMAKDPPQ